MTIHEAIKELQQLRSINRRLQLTGEHDTATHLFHRSAGDALGMAIEIMEVVERKNFMIPRLSREEIGGQ